MKYVMLMADGTETEVDVRHGDKLRAEREMIARGFGTPKEASMSWLTLATWRAAQRAELDVADDFDAFANSLESIGEASDEDDAAPFPEEQHTAG